MATDFSKLFSSLGLSPTETKVYLSSLKLGPTSIQEIAKKARLSRTATYDAVAALQEYGLMSTFQRGKKNFFSAEDPERAVQFFKGKIQGMKGRLEALVSSIDEMKMMTGGERPTVRFYEGNEALYALYTDLSKVHPETFCEVSNIDDVYEFLDTKYLHEIRKLLDTSNMKSRLLHRGELRNPIKNFEYCELLPELGDFHGDIWIYGNRVAFVEFIGKVLAVIVESQTLADTARVLFNAAWQTCEKQKADHRDH